MEHGQPAVSTGNYAIRVGKRPRRFLSGATLRIAEIVFTHLCYPFVAPPLYRHLHYKLKPIRSVRSRTRILASNFWQGDDSFYEQNALDRPSESIVHNSIDHRAGLALAGCGGSGAKRRSRRATPGVARLSVRCARCAPRSDDPGVHAEPVDISRHGTRGRSTGGGCAGGRGGHRVRRLRRRWRDVGGAADPGVAAFGAGPAGLYPRSADGGLWPVRRGAGADRAGWCVADRHRRLRRAGVRGPGDGARRRRRRDRGRSSPMHDRAAPCLCAGQSQPAGRG
jgi:hypothetical protein